MTLTPRQHEVLRLIATGRANKQIANDLGISQKTVEKHRTAIYEKAGSGPHTAVGVVMQAIREGLITV